MTVTDSLLAPLLATDPARPLVTFYDDARGERIELSGQTFDNWVAKTANLLRDEADVLPGHAVAVLLPAHWQTAAVLFAAWACGAHVVGRADDVDVDVALADAEHLPDARAAGLVIGLSLDAFGAGLGAALPDGAVDYATEVRVHGDHFAVLDPVPETGPALAGASVGEVVGLARSRAAELDLGPSDRVLSTLDWPVAAGGGLVDGLLAPVAAGASLVLVRHPGDLDRTATNEKVTRRLTGAAGSPQQ